MWQILDCIFLMVILEYSYWLESPVAAFLILEYVGEAQNASSATI
jgi:hypothetical protein